MNQIQERPAEQVESAADIVFPEPNAAGEGEHPMQSGTAMLAVRMALGLKELRIKSGMAIKDVAERSGLDVGTLSRLENGRIFNPRLDTLSRYAMAVGYEIDARYVPTEEGSQA